MADNLMAFMAENVQQSDMVEYVASTRFKDPEGKPMAWKLRAIDSTKDLELRKSCQKRIPVKGRKGQYTKETDQDEYVAKVAVACTVFPNLNDVKLQDSYKVMGAENLLRKMLLSGEYAEYIQKIEQINGFEGMDDLVDEAKNS